MDLGGVEGISCVFNYTGTGYPCTCRPVGYTGTTLWIDPENEIIVILLTNRVHPTRERGGIYGIRREFHTQVMKTLLN